MTPHPPSRIVLVAAVFVALEVSVALDTLQAREAPRPRLDYQRMTKDARIMNELASMVDAAESTLIEDEIAAFLVRDSFDRFSVIRWPRLGVPRTETWQGPIPRGTVAVIHTHPNGWSKPSPGDHGEVARTGLPFIVLTPKNIWVAEPDHRHATPILRNREWTEESRIDLLEPLDDRETRTASGLQNPVSGNHPAGETLSPRLTTNH